MKTPKTPALARADLIELSHNSIWRLFESGYIDDEMATTALLAIDLGSRRMLRRAQAEPSPDGAAHIRRAA